MAYKVAHGGKEAENIKETVESVRAKSFTEKVGKVEGVLKHLNEKIFPNFPLAKDKIAKELSLFVDWSGKNATLDLTGLPEELRSLSFKIRLSDRYENVYSYINIKGVGLLKGANRADDVGVETIKPFEPVYDSGDVWGLLDYDSAKADWDASNLFLENGIKTSAPIAIIEIKEVIMPDGKKVSVDELKKQAIISKEYAPVLYLRGLSEFMRVADAKKEDFENFAKEHGMTLNEYLGWWIDRQAENIAKIHKLGKAHHSAHEGNLTIDGYIIDNDDTRPINEKWLVFDIALLMGAIGNLSEKTGTNDMENRVTFFRKYLGYSNAKKEGFERIYYREGLPRILAEVLDHEERKGV
jgi:hypothetical protein